MNEDYKILKQDLSKIGLGKGDSVFLHSSYKSMGEIEGGIETFINAVLSVIGDSGTLIVPAFTYRYVTETERIFDYLNMPSCVGAISEFVRHLDGARRSIHPTHSCSAIGYKRDWYIEGHEEDRTPVGKNSPLYKLKEDGGKVLMLGCSVASNTSIHGIEEHFPTSYVLPAYPTPYTIVLPEKTYQIDFYRHHIHQHGYTQRYDRLLDVLDETYRPEGKIHGARSWLIDAPQMWKAGFSALKKNEFFFVDKAN